MRSNILRFAAISSLAFVSTAVAAITGDTYNFSTSETGTVTITPLGAGGSFTAPAGPFFCVGPNTNNCASSGLSGSISFTANQIVFSFSGSTSGATGTFVLNLTGFVPANILNVGNQQGTLASGAFALTSFTSSSMVFTGSVNDGNFSAIGGRTITFDVTTVTPPTISKSFGSPAIGVGQNTGLLFTINNPNAATTLTGVSFTDTLPANLVVATPNGLSVGSGCGGGTVTATAGSGTIILSGVSIQPTFTCPISLNVTATSAGTAVNSVTVNSTNGGTGNTATATVVVATPPTITKAFTPAKIVPGGTSALSFTITNPNAATTEQGIAFTDTLPTGVTVASPNGLSGACGGTVTAATGSSTVSLTGGTLAGGASCTITVNVTSNEGIKANSVTVSSTFGTGNTATATLSVATPPVLSKTFAEVSIGPLNTVNLTFTLLNPNAAVTLNALAFTDTLPTGLVVATPSIVTGSCDAGTITAVAGSNTISLTGAARAPGASCTFTVAVTANGAALSTLTNTTSTVTSTEATPGAAATANIFVGDPFQVSYAANLSVGDSVANITNTGALGAALQSGTTATITGAVCANVYAFTPDEQLVSCCSCPVTPGGLVSLSAKNDLASNTLTPAVPTALVIKLVASVPVGGSCTNSAASVTAASLANGMKSFETTIHATPTAGTYGVTEIPFSPATMSAGELSRITNLCNFILANGSGFGVCRSCRLGGLGADRQ